MRIHTTLASPRHAEGSTDCRRECAALLVPVADLCRRVTVRERLPGSSGVPVCVLALQPDLLNVLLRSPAEGAYSEGFLKAMLTQARCLATHLRLTASPWLHFTTVCYCCQHLFVLSADVHGAPAWAAGL